MPWVQTFQTAGQCLSQLLPTQNMHIWHKFHMSHPVLILHIQVLGYTSKLFAPAPGQTCLLSALSVHSEKMLTAQLLRHLALLSTYIFLLLKNSILTLKSA